MSVIAIIAALVVIGLAVGAIGTRQGWFKDADGDNIPDAIEDVIDDVKEAKKKLTRKKPGRKPRAKKSTGGAAPKVGKDHYKGVRKAGKTDPNKVK